MNMIKCVNFIWIFLIYEVIEVKGQCAGTRCGECIVSGPNCVWCKQPSYNGSRCDLEATLTSNGCSSGNIVKHPQSTVVKHRDEPLRDGGPGVEPIQLRPQNVTIRLVPNKEFTFKFKYRVAENFPVDIYFLVDPSYTMRTLRTKLAELSNQIADSIGQLTTDYRFGYGTSMDKVTLPYTHTTPEYLANPCPGTDASPCDPPHSFIHRLSLTSNVEAFKQVVSDTRTTANRDKTEGLFDGVMQVAVCGNKIGWRNKARRILLYASDVDFHFAGDGKLAGIVRPHDFGCYLEAQSGAPNFLKYTHDTILDYPSVGQIRKAVLDNNINTIFVISDSEGAKNYYDKLNPDIPGSFTQELNADANNILTIIRDTYEKLRGIVKFVNDPFKNINAEYWSACGGRTSLTDKRDTCENITVGAEIEFQFRMTLDIQKCPDSYSDRMERSSIHPEGLEDRLDVNVEYICDCDCQSPSQAVENATECSQQGRLECGVCHCNPGWSGDKCDCDISKTEEETCGQIKDGKTIFCGNVGECRCGRCECPPDYTGKYCECNNKACGGYISTGELCNGNGMCECGTCKCNAGYNGTTCDCSTSTDACRNSNGTLCSDNGQCVCGKCVCDTNYRGAQCQECPTCQGCDANKDCAECVGFQKGKYNEAQCLSQCPHVMTTEELKVENVTACQFIDSDRCRIEFTYEYDEDYKLRVEVKSSRVCPPGPPDATVLALGVSGAIFLVGLLLLLLWKILTSLLDTMEYKKFETEINDPKWGFEKNPIYKDCVTEFKNPMCDIPQGPDSNPVDTSDVKMRKK